MKSTVRNGQGIHKLYPELAISIEKEQLGDIHQSSIAGTTDPDSSSHGGTNAGVGSIRNEHHSSSQSGTQRGSETILGRSATVASTGAQELRILDHPQVLSAAVNGSAHGSGGAVPPTTSFMGPNQDLCGASSGELGGSSDHGYLGGSSLGSSDDGLPAAYFSRNNSSFEQQSASPQYINAAAMQGTSNGCR